LVIPVFQEFIFGAQKQKKTGFLRISVFSCVFRRNFSQELGFGGGCRNSCFLPISQEFFTGIPVGQEFLYLPRISPDSSGFLRIPPDSCSRQIYGTTNEGFLLSKKLTKLEIRPFLTPQPGLTMASTAPSAGSCASHPPRC
jgi:hypothetical protein